MVVMKKLWIIIILPLICSCATLFNATHDHIVIMSNPPGAAVKIINRDSIVIFEGKTPTELLLKAGLPYFRSNKCDIVFEKEGFEKRMLHIKPGIHTSYFLNFFPFLMSAGALVIDPLLGSVYQFKDRDIEVELIPRNKEKPKREEKPRLYKI